MRGSLYDRYMLSNSTRIPEFQGSAGAESIQVAGMKQQAYDQNLGAFLQLNSSLDNVTSHPKDAQYAQDLIANTKKTLRTVSESGDYENMMPQAIQAGSEFSNRYRELIAPLQQRAQWQKELDENKTLSGDQKVLAKAIADRDYQGLQRGPDGKLVGTYQGTPVNNLVDIPKWVREVGAPIVSQKLASEGYHMSPDGKWLTKTGQAVDSLGAKRIQQVLSDAMSADPTVQGHIDMMGRLNGYQGSANMERMKEKNLPDTLEGGKPNTVKQQAKELARSAGVPFGKALSLLVDKQLQSNTRKQITQDIMNIGVGTFAKNDRKSSVDMSADPYSLKATKEGPDNEFRINGAGPNTSTFDWEQNYEEVTANSSEAEKAVAKLQEDKAIVMQKLARASGNSKTQLQLDSSRINEQIKANQSIDDRSKSVLNNTRDEAVKRMNISDGKGGFVTSYEQLKTNQRPRLLEEVKKNMGDLKGVTPDEIVDAIISNKITTISVPYSKGVLAIKKGGQTIPLSAKLIDAYDAIKDNQITKAESMAKDIHKDVSKNFSVTADAIGLSDDESKAISNYGVAGAKVYEKPGSLKQYTDEDIQSMKFVPEKYNIQTNRLTGKFTDGKTFTAPMDVEYPSNIKPEIRANIIKRQGTSASDWSSVTNQLGPTSLHSAIKDMRPNEEITTVPGTDKALKLYNGKSYEPVSIILDSRGGTPEWVLKDASGNVIKKGNSEFRTSKIATVDKWVQNLIHD